MAEIRQGGGWWREKLLSPYTRARICGGGTWQRSPTPPSTLADFRHLTLHPNKPSTTLHPWRISAILPPEDKAIVAKLRLLGAAVLARYL